MRNNEIKKIINAIEIASDEIVKNMEINDLTVGALRRIKNAVSRIESAVTGRSEDLQIALIPVLNRILGYIHQAGNYPEAIHLYADRINSNVEDYILLLRSYDDEYENHKDQETSAYVEIRRSCRRLDAIADEMNQLVESKINGGYTVDSARYKEYVARYNDLQRQLNSEKFNIDHLQAVVEENSYIRQEIEKSLTLNNMTSLRTMTFEDYMDMAVKNKDRDIEERGLLSAFKRVAEETSIPDDFYVVDDSAFRKAVEDTLLERLYKESTETFDEQVRVIPKDEIYDAIIQLSRKLDKVEADVNKSEGEQKKLAEQLEEKLNNLLCETLDIVALRDDVGGDIQKEVEYCLMRTPMDIQSAEMKIRSRIELYCRFEKGIDLNDKLFFRPGETVENKLTAAGITDNLFRIAKMYRNTNRFIHLDETTVAMTDADKEKEVEWLRKNSASLKEWGIDKYDVKRGMPLFYLNQDKQLVKMIDEGRMNLSVYEVERDNKIRHYFERMESLKAFMEKNGISVPDIQLKSYEDVENYISDKEKTPKTIAPQKPVETQNVANTAKPREAETRCEGVITWYDSARGCGKIDNKLYFNKKFFQNENDCVQGQRVSYVMGRNEVGPCAKKIIAIKSKEMAER